LHGKFSFNNIILFKKSSRNHAYYRSKENCHFDQREKSEFDSDTDFPVEDSFEMTILIFAARSANEQNSE
jgi:hypothetical protein